jgi:4-hydroxy-L-threonine phosphate dehydrogenase PdxA
MAVAQTQRTRRPRVAVTLGDAAGIGPELIAKLLSKRENLEKADIVVLADRSELEAAMVDAGGVKIPISDVAGPDGVQVLDDQTAPSKPLARSLVSLEAGERCIHQLQRGLDLAEAGQIDAIVFGPLNKTSLKLAGMKEEDELRWFAKQLKFAGKTSEINIAGPLWTARVTSHIGLEKVAGMITKESTLEAIELLNRLRYVSVAVPSNRIMSAKVQY